MRNPGLRRLALLSLALAVACGTSSAPDPGPLDSFYEPSGLAVHGRNLLVASSNLDLRYSLEEGGTLISVNPRASADPGGAKLVSSVHVGSYTGELAVADAAECGGAGLAESVAVVASRATTALYPVAIGSGGTLRCDGCAVPLASAYYADPLAVGVACTGASAAAPFARAYVGYLRSFDGRGWISEYDLVGGTLRSIEVSFGPVRGIAFDRERERLWLAAVSSGGDSRLTWVDLSGGCALVATGTPGACGIGHVPVAGLPLGLEFRSIALSTLPRGLAAPPLVRRAYVTGRLYDRPAASTAGGRNSDYGGLLVSVDLAENATGGIDATWRKLADLGTGAAEVRVLPSRARADGSLKRDVVAALDGTALTIYDDETGDVRVFGVDPATGAPVLGRFPWGIAVDAQPDGAGCTPPVPANGGCVARLYVGSFQESFVTPIDVPLDDPASACIVSTAGTCLGASASTPGRITGGKP